MFRLHDSDGSLFEVWFNFHQFLCASSTRHIMFHGWIVMMSGDVTPKGTCFFNVCFSLGSFERWVRKRIQTHLLAAGIIIIVCASFAQIQVTMFSRGMWLEDEATGFSLSIYLCLQSHSYNPQSLRQCLNGLCLKHLHRCHDVLPISQLWILHDIAAFLKTCRMPHALPFPEATHTNVVRGFKSPLSSDRTSVRLWTMASSRWTSTQTHSGPIGAASVNLSRSTTTTCRSFAQRWLGGCCRIRDMLHDMPTVAFLAPNSFVVSLTRPWLLFLAFDLPS